MRHLITTALMTAAFALPLSAAAQERYPALTADQLNPEQKAYLENLQKPPRSNTTALKNPPYKVYMRSPELAAKLEAAAIAVSPAHAQEPLCNSDSSHGCWVDLNYKARMAMEERMEPCSPDARPGESRSPRRFRSALHSSSRWPEQVRP